MISLRATVAKTAITAVVYSPVFASNLETRTEAPFRRHHRDHEITIGTELQYFDYKESVPSKPSFKSEERGMVPGIAFTYRLAQRKSPFSLMAQLNYSGSSVLYDGGLQDGTPLVTQSGLSITQVQLTTGYSLFKQSGHELTLFAGIHSRTWVRQLDTLKKAPGSGYDETYSRLAIPVGFQWKYSLNDRFEVGLEPSIALPLSGFFELTYPGATTMEGKPAIFGNTLKSGTSFRVQAPVTYWIHPDYGLSLNLFFETLTFQESHIATLFYVRSWQTATISEPDSRTYHYGSQIRLHIRM